MQILNLYGKIVEIGETQSFGRTGSFSKRDVIIYDENEIDPTPIKISFKQSKIALLETFKRGDLVSINFYVDGRKWENPTKGIQYFVDLCGITIEPFEVPF